MITYPTPALLLVISLAAAGHLFNIYVQEADVTEINYNSHPSLLSDTPELDGGVLQDEAEEMHAELADVHRVPQVQHEPWYGWLSKHEYEDGLAEAVQDAGSATDVSGAAILATLWHESRLRHHGGDGRVKRGDGGRAIGIGQVHREPWQDFWTKQTGVEFNLDEMYDNVLACALIIKRGGWERGAAIVKQEAYSYYNTGKRGKVSGYGRRVHKLEQEIEGAGSE